MRRSLVRTRPQNSALPPAPVSACRGPKDVLVAAWFGPVAGSARGPSRARRARPSAGCGTRAAGGFPRRASCGRPRVAGEVELHRDTGTGRATGTTGTRTTTAVLHVSLSAGGGVDSSGAASAPGGAPYDDPPGARRRFPPPPRRPDRPVSPLTRAASQRPRRFGLEGLARRRRFAAWAKPAPRTAWRGLAESMGYGANYEAFRALAFHVPWAAFDALPPGPARAETVEAALLDASGLSPADPGDQESRVRLLRLHASLPPRRPEPFRPAAWRPAVRPPDAPVRRFAALAALAAHESPAALVARCAAEPALAATALLVPPFPYWDLRSAWGLPPFAPAPARRPRPRPRRRRLRPPPSSSPSARPRRRRASVPHLPTPRRPRHPPMPSVSSPTPPAAASPRPSGLHHLYRTGCPRPAHAPPLPSAPVRLLP